MNKDYLWNTFAGIIDAVEAVIISIVVTRITGLEDAGYFTIAFAIGNLLMSIGKYGVYGFQVTDYKNEYSYHDYLSTRFVTNGVMTICLLGYVVCEQAFNRNPIEKSVIILAIGIIYIIESFEDLIKAECQRAGKLYAGAIMFVIRWMTILLSFIVALFVKKNAQIAIVVSAILSLVVFVICKILIKKYVIPYSKTKSENEKAFTGVFSLLKKCFPIFLYTFLTFYVSNASKYALDKYSSASVQACFGFVAMPVFVISLLSGFIYQPQMVAMSEEYNCGRINEFAKRIRKQFELIAIISAACIAGADFIGIPVLSLLFGTNLDPYKRELLVMVLAGGLLAVSAYQSVILTTMREQKYLLYGYLPVSVFMLVSVYPITYHYGTFGAAIDYLINMIILCVIFQTIIGCKLKGFRISA